MASENTAPEIESHSSDRAIPPAGSHSNESRAAKMLREIFESGRPLTYIRSAEEQRVGRVLREVSQGLFASAPTPVWTWSLTVGLHRDGAAPEAGHRILRAEFWISSSRTPAPASSTSRISTSRCVSPRRSDAVFETSTKTVSTSGSSSSSHLRSGSFLRNLSGA